MEPTNLSLNNVSKPMACGICDLSKITNTQAGQYLKLKGICEGELWRIFDLDYYVHGTKDGRPHFKESPIGTLSKVNLVGWSGSHLM